MDKQNGFKKFVQENIELLVIGGVGIIGILAIMRIIILVIEHILLMVVKFYTWTTVLACFM